MQIKKEYIILFVIIIALSLYLILRDPDRTLYRLPKIPPVAASDISKIEISTPNSSIMLIGKEDQWQIAQHNYKVDAGKIKEMLDIIGNLTVTALVSESKNYERYALNKEDTIMVKAWAENRLKRKFEVGKKAPSLRHTFVKLDGDDRVYHAQGNFRDDFEQTVDDLRDKTVLAFDKTEIDEIRIANDEKSILLIQKKIPKKNDTDQKEKAESPDSPTPSELIWQNAEGKEVRKILIDHLLATLSHLNCEKYLYNSSKEDLKNPIYTLELIGSQKLTLSIFAKTDKKAKEHPAVSSDNDQPFLLSEKKAIGIMMNPDNLLEKNESFGSEMKR